MTVGRFNIMDMATVKISVNGKTQVVDMAGPQKLKGYGTNEKIKVVTDESNEQTKNMANGRGTFEESQSVDPMA